MTQPTPEPNTQQASESLNASQSVGTNEGQAQAASSGRDTNFTQIQAEQVLISLPGSETTDVARKSKPSARHDKYEYNKNLIEEFSKKSLFNDGKLTLKDIYVRPKCIVKPECLDSQKNKDNQNEIDTFELLESLIDIRRNTFKDYSIQEKVKKDRWLIFGFPGQGKTSFCKFIAHELLINQNTFTKNVYIIELRSVKKDDLDSFLDNPLDYIKNHLHREVFKSRDEDISEELQGSLIILDGIDELDITRTYLEGEYERFIEKIIAIEDDLFIMMTSRYIDINLQKLSKYCLTNYLPLILHLVKFNKEQQKEWLKKYKIFHPDIKLKEEDIDCLGELNNEALNLKKLKQKVKGLEKEKQYFDIKHDKIKKQKYKELEEQEKKIQEDYNYPEIEKNFAQAYKEYTAVKQLQSSIELIEKLKNIYPTPEKFPQYKKNILEEINKKEQYYLDKKNKKQQILNIIKHKIDRKKEQLKSSLRKEENYLKSSEIESEINQVHEEIKEIQKKLDKYKFFKNLKPIQELVSQPLFLYMIAKTNIDLNINNKSNSNYTINKTTLYKEVMDKTIENLFKQIVTRDFYAAGKVRILHGVTRDDYRAFIQDLAFAIFLTGTEVISFDEAKIHVNEFLKKLNAFNDKNPNLLKGILPTFYFKNIEDEEGLIEFAHKSFREFMATERIWSLLNKLDEGNDLAEQNSWLMNIVSKQIITEEMFASLKQMISSCNKESKDKIFKILKEVFLDKILQINFLKKRTVQEISIYFFNIYSILRLLDNSVDFLLDETKKSVFVKELIMFISIYERIQISLEGQSISKDDFLINTNNCSFTRSAPTTTNKTRYEETQSFRDFYLG